MEAQPRPEGLSQRLKKQLPREMGPRSCTPVLGAALLTRPAGGSNAGAHRWKDGKMERWKDGRIEGWKDGRTEGQKDGRTKCGMHATRHQSALKGKDALTGDNVDSPRAGLLRKISQSQ